MCVIFNIFINELNVWETKGQAQVENYSRLNIILH